MTLNLCSQVQYLAFHLCIFLTFKAKVSCLEVDLRLPGFLVTPSVVAMVAVCCRHNKPGFYGIRCYARVGPVLRLGVTSRHHTPLSAFCVGFVESISEYKYCGSVIIWWKSMRLTEQMQSKWRRNMNYALVWELTASFPQLQIYSPWETVWTMAVSIVTVNKSLSRRDLKNQRMSPVDAGFIY